MLPIPTMSLQGAVGWMSCALTVASDDDFAVFAPAAFEREFVKMCGLPASACQSARQLDAAKADWIRGRDYSSHVMSSAGRTRTRT